MEKRLEEHRSRLKKMGWTFIAFAIVVSGITYLIPNNETIYWLSHDGKQGFYVLSSLFFFLGFYCLGAIWRGRNFI